MSIAAIMWSAWSWPRSPSFHASPPLRNAPTFLTFSLNLRPNARLQKRSRLCENLVTLHSVALTGDLTNDTRDPTRRRCCVQTDRHLVQNHFHALTGRAGVTGALCLDHQRRKLYIRVGRRQDQTAIPGQATPPRQLVAFRS